MIFEQSRKDTVYWYQLYTCINIWQSARQVNTKHTVSDYRIKRRQWNFTNSGSTIGLFPGWGTQVANISLWTTCFCFRVLQFHVAHFYALQFGLLFSCPTFSRLAFSAIPVDVIYVWCFQHLYYVTATNWANLNYHWLEIYALSGELYHL